jgi:hypothetical protein
MNEMPPFESRNERLSVDEKMMPGGAESDAAYG